MHYASLSRDIATLHAVFELPGGWGVELSQLFFQTPNTLSNYVQGGQLYTIYIVYTVYIIILVGL